MVLESAIRPLTAQPVMHTAQHYSNGIWSSHKQWLWTVLSSGMYQMSVRGLSTILPLRRMFSRLAFRRFSDQISVGTPVTLTEVFHCYQESFQANVSTVPQLWHNCFLPNYFQFIYHPTIWCHIVFTLKELLNNLQETKIDLPICLSTSTIFSIVVGSMSGEVMRFSTARTTPSEVHIPIAVEPNLIASIAYST